jgi:CheY-like chemotaxis protein
MLQAVAATPPRPSWAASGIRSNTPPNTGHAGNEGEQKVPRALRILIVEDEMFVAMDAEAILTEAGHQVVGIAPSADDAVSSAAHLGPDVVLMDVRLQGQRDGIEAAAEIRSRFGLPVIFVRKRRSGHACAGDAGRTACPRFEAVYLGKSAGRP